MKPANRPPILYVDDEPINTELFKIIFEDSLEVNIAHSGKEGITFIQSHPELKVVISDMNMPDMDGIEFLKKVSLITPELPRIMLSGYEMFEEVEKAKKNNIIMEYIPKPFDRVKLKDTILKHI